MTLTVSDGVYFLHPEGSAWIAARFRGGRITEMTEEANAATHVAANDLWARLTPSEGDVVIEDTALAAAIVREVMGDDVEPGLVTVSQLITTTKRGAKR